MTAEALALYLSKLKPKGLLVMHISNRYADLARVFRGWRQMTGQRVAIDEYVPSVAEQAQGARSIVAVAIGRVPAGPAVRWTDDHVNLNDILLRERAPGATIRLTW
jgi:hypothetical protein